MNCKVYTYIANLDSFNIHINTLSKYDEIFVFQKEDEYSKDGHRPGYPCVPQP